MTTTTDKDLVLSVLFNQFGIDDWIVDHDRLDRIIRDNPGWFPTDLAHEYLDTEGST